MAFAELWLPIIGAGICIAWAIGAWYGGERIFATWLVFAGFICLGLLAILQWQHYITKQNNSIAAAKTEDPNRPWVSVHPEIGSDLTYDAQGNARVVINFILQNVGKFPAANVQVDAEIVPIFGDARPLQKAIADRNNLRPAGLGNLGVTIFPGPPQIISLNLPISHTAIEAFNKKMVVNYGADEAKKMGMMYLPTLVGVVDYKFTFAEGHHQTGFILDLRMRDLKHPNLALGFNVKDGTIPKSRLWLIQGFISVPPD
jgi:hypothetical protein